MQPLTTKSGGWGLIPIPRQGGDEVKVRLLRPTIVAGKPCAAGEVVSLPDSEALMLIGLGKAEAVKSGVETASVEAPEQAVVKQAKPRKARSGGKRGKKGKK